MKISASLIVSLLIAPFIFGVYLDFGTGYQTYSIASVTGIFSLVVLVGSTLLCKAALRASASPSKNIQNAHSWKGWVTLIVGLVVFGSLFYYYFSQPYRVVNTGKHIYHAWAFGLMFAGLFIAFLQILVVLLYHNIKK